MKKIFEIIFMRGDVFKIVAKTESEAFRILKMMHPETQTYDVLKVRVADIAQAR